MPQTIVERLQASGIRRLGSKRSGFRYLMPDGRRASAPDRERIESLRIPPAWKRVAIHPSPQASVQAVGLDAAGRWQYRYHPSQVPRRERARRERIIRFTGALPRIRRVLARDLELPGIPREKVLAGILRVLSTCFLRPGSESYAAENGTYGIATLEPRHVSVRGDVVGFDFVGKSGKRQTSELRDRRLARLLRELLRYRGEVFKYRNERGELRDIRRSHINAYIKANMGEAFSAKDFRTWAGSLLCACALARSERGPDASKTAVKRQITAAIREVAGHLGNTPAVCRSSYVLPDILRSYERGAVIDNSLHHAGELAESSVRRIELAEKALLRLLLENRSNGRRNGNESRLATPIVPTRPGRRLRGFRPPRRPESSRAPIPA